MPRLHVMLDWRHGAVVPFLLWSLTSGPMRTQGPHCSAPCHLALLAPVSIVRTRPWNGVLASPMKGCRNRQAQFIRGFKAVSSAAVVLISTCAYRGRCKSRRKPYSQHRICPNPAYAHIHHVKAYRESYPRSLLQVQVLLARNTTITRNAGQP